MRHDARTTKGLGAAILGFSLLLVPAADAAPLAGFVARTETRNLTVYARADAKVTSDGQRQIERIATLLGQADVPRFEYYQHESASEIAAYVGHFVSGITFPSRRRIHSTRDAQDHELVHAVASQLGNPGAFFHEGLAVVLGNKGRWQGRKVDEQARRTASGASFRSLLAAFEPSRDGLRFADADSYAVAGSFMAHLEKRHGIAKVAAFFRACPNPQRVEAAFVQTFGLSLDEAGATWTADLHD